MAAYVADEPPVRKDYHRLELVAQDAIRASECGLNHLLGPRVPLPIETLLG